MPLVPLLPLAPPPLNLTACISSFNSGGDVNVNIPELSVFLGGITLNNNIDYTLSSYS